MQHPAVSVHVQEDVHSSVDGFLVWLEERTRRHKEWEKVVLTFLRKQAEVTLGDKV